MKIPIVVTLFHLLALYLFNLNKEISLPKPKNKILVRTIVETKKAQKNQTIALSKPQNLPIAAPIEEKSEDIHYEEIKEEKVTLIVSPQPAPSAKPCVKPLEKKVTKKEEKPKKKKEVTKAKTQPSKKPSETAKKGTTSKEKTSSKNSQATKKSNKGDEKLLNMMKEGISNINKASSSLKHQSKTTGNVSYTKIDKLQSEDFTLPIELSYAEELAAYMKRHLHFPDEGTMKVVLTLNREGKVQDFKILSSSSEKNQSLGQKSIPSLTFPSFGDRFKKDTTKSFTLVFNIEV